MAVNLKGGAKLKAYLTRLSKKVERSAVLRVGFLEGATYPNGTPVAMIAAIQEFGAPKAGIPPRSYFRPLIAKSGASILFYCVSMRRRRRS